MKPIQVRDELLNKGIRIFTPIDFERIFHTPSYTTKYFLENQTKEGLFLRLKQGLYTLNTDLPREEEIANKLYTPSYLSFEYALAYHHILPEMPYIVTSATTKPTRLFSVGDKSFSYQSIKIAAFTGYSLVKNGNAQFFMADPEKALVDYLYFVVLGKKEYNERFYIKSLSVTKIKQYAKLYKRTKLNEFIKNLYA